MTTQQTNQSEWMKSLTSAYPKFQAITNPEKAKSELGFAMQIFQGSPYLQKCEPQSILNAVVNVARTSITLNPVMRLAYLIPRKNKCVLEFSYMGLVAMLRDNGCIKSISAHIVYEDEEFDYNIAENKIYHKPTYAKSENEHNARETIGCYSRATLPNNEVVYEFMPMWELDKVRSMSEGSGSKYSAWNTWRDEMIKKSVIKRHFKMLISGNPTEALATAMKVENDNNALSSPFNNNNEKQSLMNAFENSTEVVNQIEQESFSFDTDKTDTKTQSEASFDFQNVEETPINPNDLTDEQIEMEMDKQAKLSESDTIKQQEELFKSNKSTSK